MSRDAAETREQTRVALLRKLAFARQVRVLQASRARTIYSLSPLHQIVLFAAEQYWRHRSPAVLLVEVRESARRSGRPPPHAVEILPRLDATPLPPKSISTMVHNTLQTQRQCSISHPLQGGGTYCYLLEPMRGAATEIFLKASPTRSRGYFLHKYVGQLHFCS